MFSRATAAILVVGIVAAAPTSGFAQQPAAKQPAEDAQQPTLKRLSKTDDVWIDVKRKLVVVGGEICLREGMLEMFACPKRTKEHEAIVAVDSKAYVIHAALLAVGAKAGQPVKFHPQYEPASGSEIDVLVLWRDADGKKRQTPAQQWIRNVKTRQPMKHAWVFAGSGFWEDPDTGQRHYHAESGDMICVSNFSTAMMDLPVESPQGTSALLFDAFTDRIPPLGTKVRLVLKPKVAAKPAEDEKSPAASDE